ncbi:MAG: GNAT family N-acetyltransferase, partial [Candidatus Hodarchaeota archaeon]
MLENFNLESFSEENLEDLHEFFEKHAGLHSFSFKSFKGVTLKDDDFDPSLALVAREKDSGMIIAAFFAIIRNAPMMLKGRAIPYKFTTLNMFAVHQDYRNQGIGTAMLDELVARLKKKGRNKVRLMGALPQYLFPGLDPRYTKGFCFLRKHGFKKKGERINLLYDIPDDFPKPPGKLKDIRYSRATDGDLDELNEFLKKRPGVWAREVQFSLEEKPYTTFIARNQEGVIVGYASHSIGFEETFGPTEVAKSERGKGIGGTLLKWCVYDLKEMGISQMVIRWVVGHNIHYYSK